MQDPAALEETNRVARTADVVAAYVANNSVAAADLPQLIASVHQTFGALLSPPPEEKPTPRIPIKKSITPDHLISLEDGKPYKSLKRHLGRYGLTPVEYRMKWGLPPDYPMVAPNYAKQRSELAKSLGLGQQRRRRAEPPVPPAIKGRSRSKKSPES